MRLISLGLLLVSSPLLAQTAFAPLLIDGPTARQHLVTHPDPEIPPIARAAHVFGTVTVQVEIDPTGHVIGATVLSAAPMLIGAATANVRSWAYTPFTQNDQPVFATTVVTLTYGPDTPLPKHSDPASLQNYYRASGECGLAEHDNRKPADVAKVCAKLSAAADALPQDQYFWERRAAYLRTSNAFLHNNQPDDALAEADKAVAVAKLGHDSSHDIALAYATRAQAESSLNKLSAADADLTIAEDAEHGAIATIQSDTMKKNYVNVLKAILYLHSRVLTSMGNAQTGRTEIDEADKL
jgi:TonB family protein